MVSITNVEGELLYDQFRITREDGKGLTMKRREGTDYYFCIQDSGLSGIEGMKILEESRMKILPPSWRNTWWKRLLFWIRGGRVSGKKLPGIQTPNQ